MQQMKNLHGKSRPSNVNKWGLILLFIVLLELVLIIDQAESLKGIKKKLFLKKIKKKFLFGLLKPKKKPLFLPIPIPINMGPPQAQSGYENYYQTQQQQQPTFNPNDGFMNDAYGANNAMMSDLPPSFSQSTDSMMGLPSYMSVPDSFGNSPNVISLPMQQNQGQPFAMQPVPPQIMTMTLIPPKIDGQYQSPPSSSPMASAPSTQLPVQSPSSQSRPASPAQILSYQAAANSQTHESHDNAGNLYYNSPYQANQMRPSNRWTDQRPWAPINSGTTLRPEPPARLGPPARPGPPSRPSMPDNYNAEQHTQQQTMHEFEELEPLMFDDHRDNANYHNSGNNHNDFRADPHNNPLLGQPMPYYPAPGNEQLNQKQNVKYISLPVIGSPPQADHSKSPPEPERGAPAPVKSPVKASSNNPPAY